MKSVLKMGQSDNSSANVLRAPIVILLTIAALTASAAAGAWVQAKYAPPAQLSPEQQRAITQQVSRDSSYIRGNVEVLAEKVGDLQAKVIEMDVISKRVADVAGVSYTDPEVHATLEQTAVPVMDYIPHNAESVSSAQGLGRQLDFLERKLASQKDWYSMIDLVLTRRAGVEAGLPTLMPVDYPYLSSSFGWRRHPISGRHVMHEGLDFAAPTGTPIYAASGGVVAVAGYKSGYGKTVEIHHGNDLVTRYAHASAISVKVGDLVEKGALIGKVGSTGHSTGPHLHFEVRMAGHPLDPTLFLAKPEPAPSLVADASEHVHALMPEVR